MKKSFTLFLAGSLCCFFSFSQTRIVFNNDAYMVIDNGAFVVVGNSNANAITQTGTGGRIVSELENDRLRWMVGTATGTYVVPFATAAGIEFPLTLNVTGAGTGAGNITFSTYRGGSWDNNTYRPSDVAHMLDYTTGSVNNSSHVIDRFWIVDPLSYTTKPAATMDITYIDAEHSVAGNTIVEGSLGAQRFNNTSGIWGDYLPQGTVNTGSNIVSGIPVSSAHFFRSWTLSELTSPLPIALLGFSCGCEGEKVKLSWTVGSETDIAKYHITGSTNGVDFENITSLDPVGGYGPVTYQAEAGNQYKYYALETEEINGERKQEAIQPLNCANTANDAGAFVQQENIVLNLQLGMTGPLQVELYETSGKLVRSTILQAPAGNSSFTMDNQGLAKGIYFVRMFSVNNQFTKTVKIYK